MSNIILEAETRSAGSKGMNRRLRRLENKIPAILYGGNKEPQPINLAHKEMIKALENEAIYSSVLTLKIDNAKEPVILKALRWHPYKSIIMHIDLQRISDKDILIRHIPLHFVNKEISKGIKAGGIVNHVMTQIEVRCQAKNLPKYVEIDLANLDLNEVIHLNDIKLPKGVSLNHEEHNLGVVSIHLPKIITEPDEAEIAADEVPTITATDSTDSINAAKNN